MKNGCFNIVCGDSEFKDITALRREVLCEEYFFSSAVAEDSRDKNATHIAYIIDKTVVGCGSIALSGDGVYEIYSLAVKKHYRKFGVGKTIVRMLKDGAKQDGAKVFTAFSPIEALGFFEKTGMPKNGVPTEKYGKKCIECVENLVFDGARWVKFGGEVGAVIVKSEFDVSDDSTARLFVTGLGFCEVYINGERIADRLLAPAWTNYVKSPTQTMSYPIFDTMTNRILYENIDVTKFLKKGKNVLVFHIGGGWFAQRECPNEKVKPYGELMLCFKLVQNGKTLDASGEKTKYTKSFVKRANLYYGEDHDARLGGYDFSKAPDGTRAFLNVDITEPPLAVLSEQDCPPDRVIRTLQPTCIFKKGDYAVYDVGENVAGYPVAEFIDDAYIGESCVMRFAEELNDEGGLDFHSAGGEYRMQKDTYIHDDICREYYPRFTWHGARYFDVLGRVNIKEYRVVHTDIKPIIRFKSSNETLAWIVDAYMRTQSNNIHCCVPSDCPHRERLGYTGDGQVTADTVMTCFDAEKFYRKWMRDIADCQDIYNGHVQHTAPFYGGGGGPGGWGGAIVIVPYMFYKHYGDKKIIEQYYSNMLMYFDYMKEHSKNGLVVKEEVGGWCLGDWCSPKSRNLIPEPFVNTYFYLKTLSMATELAEIIGKPTADLKALRESVEDAFLKAYRDPETWTFCGSVEASDAYGYDLGLGNEKTLDSIVKKYTELGEFDTGIFGTNILIRTLCENGHKDLAFKLLTNEKENSFYNMKKHGATTLWEDWDGSNSHSHPMFGSVVKYIVEYFNEITD